MASRSQRIPPRFDDDFLDWFRARLEAYWAALPQRTPEEALTGYLQAGVGGSEWQSGTRWLTSLSDEEIAQVERHWRLVFPADYRLFLQRLHSEDRPRLCAGYLGEDQSPQTAEADGALATAYVEKFDQYMVLEEGPGFYNWLTNGDALEAQWAWLWEGLQFDVEHNGLWPPSWGPQPDTLTAQEARVRELVEGRLGSSPSSVTATCSQNPAWQTIRCSRSGSPISSCMQRTCATTSSSISLDLWDWNGRALTRYTARVTRS